MWILHNAQDVVEWVKDRCGNKARLAPLGYRIIFLRAHYLEPLKRRHDIIHMPVEYNASGPRLRAFRCIFTVNNAEFSLIVPDPKLDICRLFIVRVLEIRLD